MITEGDMSDKELHELLIEYAKSIEETAPTGKKKVDRSALGFAGHREGKGKCFACGRDNHFLGECKDKKKLEKYNPVGIYRLCPINLDCSTVHCVHGYYFRRIC